MNQILVINLKRSGDIFFSSNLISAIQAEHPHSQISLLVYEEFSKAAHTLTNVRKVYTIDRKAISTFKQNKLFSEAFAINTFLETMNDVNSTSWDRVVNISNDSISSYITSYLNPKIHDGVRISNVGTSVPSNKWSLYFNEVVTTFPVTPFHYVDCYHNISNVSKVRTTEKIINRPENNQVALQNFNKIRSQEAVDNKNVKLIGIQLRASNQDKEIDENEILELLDLILDSAGLVPILLVAPTKNEKDYADKINAQFGNTLFVVEFDFKASSSVLMNLDAVITPDTAIKHIADLVETPLLEVSQGYSPFYKQGTIGVGNLILTAPVHTRYFKNKDRNENTPRIKANDIFQSMLLLLGEQEKESLSLENCSLFEVREDQAGITYQPIAGIFDENREISQRMARGASLRILNGAKQPPAELNDIKFDSLIKWCQSEKNSLTEVSKTLLGSIRTLRAALDNPKAGKDFAISLENLLDHCERKNLSTIPVLLFRGKLEAITAETFKENVKEIEKLLFELKNNLQLISEYISESTENTRKEKKEDSVGQIFSFNY